MPRRFRPRAQPFGEVRFFFLQAFAARVAGGTEEESPPAMPAPHAFFTEAVVIVGASSAF